MDSAQRFSTNAEIEAKEGHMGAIPRARTARVSESLLSLSHSHDALQQL